MTVTAKSELSLAERAELHRLEAVISRGWRTFIDVGEALAKISEQRLYRETHRTFDAYCQDVWKWSRQRAYQMIDGARTARVMEEAGIPVANERDARALKPVAQLVAAAPPAQRPQVAQAALSRTLTSGTGERPPTAAATSQRGKTIAVSLYIHRLEDGTWKGLYHLNSERHSIKEGLTLAEIEALIAERIAGRKPQAAD